MTRTAINLTTDADNSASFKFKKYQAEKAMMAQKMIMLPLKYLSNFWGTLEIPLINCEFNLILSLSGFCFKIDNPVNN